MILSQIVSIICDVVTWCKDDGVRVLVSPALPRHLAVREKALGRNDIGPRRTAPPAQRPSTFPSSTTEIAAYRAHAAVVVLNTRIRPPATRLSRRLSVPGKRSLAWPDIILINTSGGNNPARPKIARKERVE